MPPPSSNSKVASPPVAMATTTEPGTPGRTEEKEALRPCRGEKPTVGESASNRREISSPALITAAQGFKTASLKALKAPQAPPDRQPAAPALTNDRCLSLLPGRNVHTSSAGSTGLSKYNRVVSGGLLPGNTPRVSASNAAPLCTYLHTGWEIPLGPVLAEETFPVSHKFLAF